jgi:hypothetical protein
LREPFGQSLLLALVATIVLLEAVPFLSQVGGVSPVEIFTDVTERAGIQWQHFNGESEDRFLIEATSGGVAFLDFDNDGWLDIFLVNGGETPKHKSEVPIRNALYRHLGSGKFAEVAEQAGVDRIPFYGMGVAAADYDNDGFQDLFVTGFPSCALFHNNGNGTFTDVTGKTGVQNSGKWAASATWFDYDRDGRLDLFICNYARFSFQDRHRCDFAGVPSYCEQKAYEGDSPRLYHNNGNGTFTDVTAPSGVEKYAGRALGVVSIDANEDGWPDLFVARDASPNLLLINKQSSTFEDVALGAEVAYSPEGAARAGMGVDAGDINSDGRPDFVVTNFNDEYHALFLNSKDLFFEEWTRDSGLAAFTRPFVGWGTHFLDYDNDSDLDLIIVNGHINEIIEKTRKDVSYKELPLLLANDGKGVFQNMKDTAGLIFRTPHSARGLAVGDFDNDGGTDIVFVCLKDKPVLLCNNLGKDNAWLGLQLEGTRSNRDAIGTKLSLRLAESKLVRWVTGGSSYLSSHDKRVVFGLGNKELPKSLNVEIRWPNGETQTITGLTPNRYQKVVEGKGGE